MLQFLEESKADIVAIRLSGDVNKHDYDEMLPVLKQRIQEHGKLKAYAEIQGVQAYSLKALWDEVKFDFKHANDFSKIAIVGDQSWANAAAAVAKPFSSAEIRHFDFEHRSDAWAWLHKA